jgi:hypothetical protein
MHLFEDFLFHLFILIQNSFEIKSCFSKSNYKKFSSFFFTFYNITIKGVFIII